MEWGFDSDIYVVISCKHLLGNHLLCNCLLASGIDHWFLLLFGVFCWGYSISTQQNQENCRFGFAEEFDWGHRTALDSDTVRYLMLNTQKPIANCRSIHSLFDKLQLVASGSIFALLFGGVSSLAATIFSFDYVRSTILVISFRSFEFFCFIFSFSPLGPESTISYSYQLALRQAQRRCTSWHSLDRRIHQKWKTYRLLFMKRTGTVIQTKRKSSFCWWFKTLNCRACCPVTIWSIVIWKHLQRFY